MNEALQWGTFCFDFLLSIGLLVVALTAVRATHATSGFMLAGAAAADLLASCCFKGEDYAQRAFGMDVFLVFGLLGIVEKILFYGLVIGAAVMLTNAVLQRRSIEPV